MRKRCFSIILAIIIFTSCNFIEKGNSMIQPKYDVDQMRMLKENRLISHAENVTLGTSFFYYSNDDFSYKLKLTVLNPVCKEDEDLFRKKLAFYVVMHLINKDDFEKIDVSVTQKTGTVLSFSKTMNSAYFIDSLYRCLK